jgi:hypothetical protein
MRALQIALPWLVGLAILWVLLRRADPAATRAALAAGQLWRFVPLALLFALLWLALDAAILAWLFGRLLGPIGWSQMAWLRAATYPAMALSFHLGSVALVGALARLRGAPLARVTGGMLVHYLGDLTALACVAGLGSLLLRDEIASHLRVPLAALSASGVALLIGARWVRPWIRERPSLETLAALTEWDLARLVAARAAFHASFALFVWLSAPSFAVQLPLVEALARMPVVLGVASLPIAPGGVGTAQAAMSWLFADFGRPSAVLAYGLAYGLALIALRVPMGAIAWSVLRWRAAARMESLA